MEGVKGVIGCLATNGVEVRNQLSTRGIDMGFSLIPTEKQVALAFTALFLASEAPSKTVENMVHNIVEKFGWTQGFAQRVLDALVAYIKSGVELAKSFKQTYESAYAAGSLFVHDHPVLTTFLMTLIAIGVLWLLFPWIVEGLGFSTIGPVKGSYAAGWQSIYPNVPAGSLFAWLQSIAMTA